MGIARWWYTLPLRWRSLVRRREVEADLDDELRDHLERRAEEHAAAGVPPDEAWRLAVRSLGSVDRTKEQCRDVRATAWLDTLAQDVRYAARTLRRAPGFAAVAVLTLALGVGANTAVFSVVDDVLIARLPYPAPERLISLTGTYPGGAFAALREEFQTADVAAYAEGHSFTLTGDAEPLRLTGARVSAELFSILGVRPALGRWLRPREDAEGRDRYVVLGYELWETRFRRDPAVVGRSIVIDGIPREVIAVMPASFRFPSARTQVWVPLGIDPGQTARYWAGDFMPVVGRLRPGAAIEQADAEIRVFQSRIGDRFPWPMPSDWNATVSAIPLHDALVGGVRSRLLMFVAAVVLVLVIACANVANLTLSRAATREREIGIRTALGASPRRIARQLLTESVVLATAGAVVGLLFASQAIAVLKLVLPPDTPGLGDARLNWRVLAFTGVLAVLTGCAFGLAPVLQAVRIRLRRALDSGGRGGGRLVAGPVRSALTIAQVACAVLLVITAGLLVRSLWTLSHLDPGFRTDDVVTARVSPGQSVCGAPERCLAFYRAVEDQLRATAGIRGAALVNTLPLTGAVAKRSLELEGLTTARDSQTAPLFWLHTVSADYFQVMDIRVQSGRAFTTEERSGRPPVAIVTASTARRFWPGTSAVGKQVRFVGEPHWHTIVGVVADVRAYHLTQGVPEWIDGVVYVPFGPHATLEDGRIPSDLTLAMRTTMDSAQATAALKRVVSGVSGEVAVDDVQPMRAVVEQAIATPAATTSLLVTMAGLALVLGCVGVYGVLSFLVSRQTRDFAIRLALGASRAHVFWLVMREGATLCAAGILIGFAGAAALTRWLSSELYDVSPTDPITYAAVAAVVSLVTAVACYVPTRRALGVDPLVVLRDA